MYKNIFLSYRPLLQAYFLHTFKDYEITILSILLLLLTISYHYQYYSAAPFVSNNIIVDTIIEILAICVSKLLKLPAEFGKLKKIKQYLTVMDV